MDSGSTKSCKSNSYMELLNLVMPHDDGDEVYVLDLQDGDYVRPWCDHDRDDVCSPVLLAYRDDQG